MDAKSKAAGRPRATWPECPWSHAIARGVATAVIALLPAAPRTPAQTTVWWDPYNGSGAAAKNGDASGTWDSNTTSAWSTSQYGGGSRTWWYVTGNGTRPTVATFSGSTDATGNSIVTVNGSITQVAGLTFEEGNVTLAQGTSGLLTLTGNATLSAGNATIATNARIDVVMGGAGNVTKAGLGTLTVAGNNTYSGTTTITQGTLAVTNLANGGSASALGNSTNAAAKLVLNGGTLSYVGNTTTTDRLFTLGTAGATLDASGTGAVTWSNTGALAMAGTGNRTLTLSGTSTANNTLAAVIGNPGTGATSLVKTGTGTWVLGGDNTFTGTTTINGGTLVTTGNATALGTGAASVLLGNGTLVLKNDNAQSYNRNLTITGNATLTADRNTAGTAVNHTLGTLSIGSSQLSVGVGAGMTSGNGGVTFGATTLTGDSTVNVTNGSAGSIVTLGALNDGGIVRTLTKTGNGNLILGTGTSSLTSGITLQINGGALNSNATTALGSLANVTVATGASFGVGAAQTIAALNGSGNVALGNVALTIGSTNNLSSSFSGSITGTGPLTKAGTGTLTLNGNSSFAGDISVNAGTLVAGANNALSSGGNISIASGAALSLAGNTSAASRSLSIAGTGVASGGALSNDGVGVTQWNGSIQLTDNATIRGNGGNTTARLQLGATAPTSTTESGYITLNQKTLTFTGSTEIAVNERIQDADGQTATTTYSNGVLTASPSRTQPGNVVIAMDAGGVVHYLANGNSYTGLTSVNSGTLLLDTWATGSPPHANGSTLHALNGDVEIGKTGTAAVVKFAAGSSELIALTSNVRVYGNGTLDLNGTHQTLNGLTLTGNALVKIGGASGELFLSGDVTVNGVSGQQAIIGAAGANEALSLSINPAAGIDTQEATRIFNIIGAGNTSDLTVNAALQIGSLVKTGNGTMTLTGASQYNGATDVQGGILSVQKGRDTNGYSALGTGAAGTTVQANATLQLAGGNVSFTTEMLTLNGNGAGGIGALQSKAGNYTWGSVNQTLIALGSDATINADSASALTIQGNVTAANHTLTLGGAGSITLAGEILNGSGGLVKADSGTVTLSHSSGSSGTRLGNITVGGGNLTISGSGTTVYGAAAALSSGTLQINSGATLDMTSLTASTGTSLVVASGGTLNAATLTANSGSTLQVNGTLVITSAAALSGTVAGTSAGKIVVNGGTLTFNSTINATSLTLELNGGTVNFANLGETVTIGTLRITGDTVLDFGNSAGTFLSSTNLDVAAGAHVTVKNWIAVANTASQSTIWYLRNLSAPPAPTLNTTTTLGTSDLIGGTPLSQITFENTTGSPGSTTTWVSGTHDGWFDHEIRPTPEPGTYGGAFIGSCVGFLVWRRRRSVRRSWRRDARVA